MLVPVSSRASKYQLVCDPEFKSICEQRLEKGEIAPFSGTLLSFDAYAAIVAADETFQKELEAAVEKERDACAVRLKSAKDQAAVDLKACQDVNDVVAQDAFADSTFTWVNWVFLGLGVVAGASLACAAVDNCLTK